MVGKQAGFLEKMREFVMFISDGFRLSTFVLEANDMHPLIEMIERVHVCLEVMVLGIDAPFHLLALLYLKVPRLKMIIHYQYSMRKDNSLSWRSPHFSLQFHLLESCVGTILRLLHNLSIHLGFLIDTFNIHRIIIG